MIETRQDNNIKEQKDEINEERVRDEIMGGMKRET